MRATMLRTEWRVGGEGVRASQRAAIRSLRDMAAVGAWMSLLLRHVVGARLV
jgi:hypothetical protein